MPADPPEAAGKAPKETGKEADKAAGKETAKETAKPCPECGKPANPATKPFCSPRCRDVDLNRWLSGAYVVAGKEDEDEDGARNDGEPS